MTVHSMPVPDGLAGMRVDTSGLARFAGTVSDRCSALAEGAQSVAMPAGRVRSARLGALLQGAVA